MTKKVSCTLEYGTLNRLKHMAKVTKTSVSHLMNISARLLCDFYNQTHQTAIDFDNER